MTFINNKQLQRETGRKGKGRVNVRERVRDTELLKSHHYQSFDKTDKAHKECLSPRFSLSPSRWYLNVHAADLSSFRSLTVNLLPSSPLYSPLPPFLLWPLFVDAINYATAACGAAAPMPRERSSRSSPGVIPVVQDRENRTLNRIRD